MQEIIKLLVRKGYKHVSLSVQKANYAVNMYLKLGFKTIKETDEEFIMVKEFKVTNVSCQENTVTGWTKKPCI